MKNGNGSEGEDEHATARYLQETRLLPALRLVSALASNVGEGLFAIDRAGRLTFMNPAAERILGWPAAESLEMRLHAVLHPACDSAECPLQQHLQTPTLAQDRDDTWIRPDGSTIMVRYTASPLVIEGVPSGTAMVFVDTTDRRLVEERLRLLESVVTHDNDAVLITEAEPVGPPGPKVLYVNHAFTRMTGYAADEIVGQTPRILHGPRTERAPLDAIRRALEAWQPVRAELLNYTRSGEEFWVELNIAPVADASGWYTHWIWIQRDITGRKQSEAALRHQSLHDALTGLPNRTLLTEHLDRALREGIEQGQQVALLLLDLNHFKEINDTLGHHLGDLILREIATRMQDAMQPIGMVARLGDDEFAVLLSDVDHDGVGRAARRLLAVLGMPCMIDGHSVEVAASMGVALFPQHARDATTLLQKADIAMYLAKGAGGDYLIYSAEQDVNTLERMTLTSDLRHALDRKELLLHYQPLVDPNGKVVGVEALARWQHPRCGMVAPDRFIPLAERANLIGPLTLWVLDEALRQSSAWRAAGIDAGMSVNLSMRTLHDPQLAETVAWLLRRHDVRPGDLTLEITESTIMANPERAMSVLTVLAGMGIRLAIDDFGTGYSSLASLRRLPVHVIKIDKSFVLGMGGDTRDAAIVRTVIELGRNLELVVVAEGVEDRAAWRLLEALGCDLMQGYYLSRPLPAAELEGWARARVAADRL